MLTISEAPVSAAEGCEQAQIATDSAQYAYNSASSDLYKAKTNAKNAFEEATRLRNIADKSGLSADKARADEAAVKEQEAEKTAAGRRGHDGCDVPSVRIWSVDLLRQTVLGGN